MTLPYNLLIVDVTTQSTNISRVMMFSGFRVSAGIISLICAMDIAVMVSMSGLQLRAIVRQT